MSDTECAGSHPPEGEESTCTAVAIEESSSNNDVMGYVAERLTDFDTRLEALKVEQLEQDGRMLQTIKDYAAETEKLRHSLRASVEKSVKTGRQLQDQLALNKALEETNSAMKKQSEKREASQVKLQQKLSKVTDELAAIKARSVQERHGKSVKRFAAKSCQTNNVDDPASLKKKISELTRELERREQTTGLTRELERREQTNSAMEQEISALKDELAKAISGHSQTKENKGVQGSISKPKFGKACQTQTVVSDPEMVKKDEAVKQSENAKLKLALDSCEGKLSKAIKELALKDEVVAIKERAVSGRDRGITALKMKLSENSKLIRVQEKDLSRMRKELALKDVQIAKIDGKVKVSAAQNKELVVTENLIHEQALEIEGLKGQLRSLDSLHASTEKQIVSADALIKSKDNELEVLRTTLANERIGFENSTATVKATLLSEQKKTAALEKSTAAMQASLLAERKKTAEFEKSTAAIQASLLAERKKTAELENSSAAFMSALLAEQNSSVHYKDTLRELDILLGTTEKVLINKEDLIRKLQETITKLEKGMENVIDENLQARNDFHKMIQLLTTQVHELETERNLLKESYEINLAGSAQYAFDCDNEISELKCRLDEAERRDKIRENQYRSRINSIAQVLQDSIDATDMKMEGCRSPVRYHYLKKRGQFCRKLHDSVFSPGRTY